jgi:hypothetical protein
MKKSTLLLLASILGLVLVAPPAYPPKAAGSVEPVDDGLHQPARQP